MYGEERFGVRTDPPKPANLFTVALNQVAIPDTNLPVLELTDIDVKNPVVEMRSMGDYGMMMMLQNEVYYNIRQFASSYNPVIAKHPKLVVVYK